MSSKKRTRSVPAAQASTPGTPPPVGRHEAARRQQATRQRRRTVLYGSGALALVLAVAGVLWYSNQGQANCASLQDPIRALYNTLPPSKPFPSVGVKLVATPYGKPLPDPGPEVQVPDEGNQHVSPLTSPIPYKHIPPASGPHYPDPAPYEFNTKEVPEGNWVHSLEHGAVVLLYQCNTGRVTMLAWDHMLPLAGVDVAQITEFYDKYVDQGPEKTP